MDPGFSSGRSSFTMVRNLDRSWNVPREAGLALREPNYTTKDACERTARGCPGGAAQAGAGGSASVLSSGRDFDDFGHRQRGDVT